jgi:hypothetical protein
VNDLASAPAGDDHRRMAKGHVPARVLRSRIEDAVAGGATLTDIEQDILSAPAESGRSTDLRAALWLFAWGLVERERVSLSTT